MLLMGMNNNFMKYPTAPITAKPTAHDPAICKNSKETLNHYFLNKDQPFLSGLVHLLMKKALSWTKSLASSMISFA